MGKPNFSDEFKRDAVSQITERGHPVAEVSQRLGVSQHSLYAWKRQLGRQVSGDASKDAEIRIDFRSPVPIIGPNRFHHSRTASWQRLMPRLSSRTSTFRRLRGSRTYIITTSRLTSGEE